MRLWLRGNGLPYGSTRDRGRIPPDHDVSRRREPADALASLGAKVVRTPAEVASEADVIVTILPADLELEQTILGAEGVLEAMAPGKVLVEMTTGTAMSLLKMKEPSKRLAHTYLMLQSVAGLPGRWLARLRLWSVARWNCWANSVLS